MQLDQNGLLILAGLIVVVLAFIAFMRYLKVRERIAWIQSGYMTPGSHGDAVPPEAEQPTDTTPGWAAAGQHSSRYGWSRGGGGGMRGPLCTGGGIVGGLGLALALGFFLTWGAGLWLLVGLIPGFVGLGMFVAGLVGGW